MLIKISCISSSKLKLVNPISQWNSSRKSNENLTRGNCGTLVPPTTGYATVSPSPQWWWRIHANIQNWKVYCLSNYLSMFTVLPKFWKISYHVWDVLYEPCNERITSFICFLAIYRSITMFNFIGETYIFHRESFQRYLNIFYIFVWNLINDFTIYLSPIIYYNLLYSNLLKIKLSYYYYIQRYYYPGILYFSSNFLSRYLNTRHLSIYRV